MKYLIMAMLMAAPAGAQVERRDFGRSADGQTVYQYILTNPHGLEARVMSYGATWTHMRVPDREGRLGDVLLGFDSLAPYLAGHPYFGSIAGRVANRIAAGRFTLDGKTYQLAVNNGPNHLHGGLEGTDKAVWQGEALEGAAVRFRYRDPDGHNGYPGNVDMEVTYTLTPADEMCIDYRAVTDRDTPINLTNHAYFNLGGEVLKQVLWLNADRYTPVDQTLIPTGQILSVKGTPFDFTTPKPIGQNLAEVPGGYDHNFVLNGSGFRPAARVTDPDNGRRLEISTDQPGIQFYSGNFLDGSLKGKGGLAYAQHQGFCLETQHFPDAVNHPDFPSVILHPGEVYRTRTVLKFSHER